MCETRTKRGLVPPHFCSARQIAQDIHRPPPRRPAAVPLKSSRTSSSRPSRKRVCGSSQLAAEKGKAQACCLRLYCAQGVAASPQASVRSEGSELNLVKSSSVAFEHILLPLSSIIFTRRNYLYSCFPISPTHSAAPVRSARALGGFRSPRPMNLGIMVPRLNSRRGGGGGIGKLPPKAQHVGRCLLGRAFLVARGGSL